MKIDSVISYLFIPIRAIRLFESFVIYSKRYSLAQKYELAH
jgi:hypothetical protein